VKDSASVGAFRCAKCRLLGVRDTEEPKGLKHQKETRNRKHSRRFESTSEKLVRSPKTNGHESTNKISSPIPAQGTTGHMTT